MDKQEIIEKLEVFKKKLETDVYSAYKDRGSAFGDQRLKSWKKSFSHFLDSNVPNQAVDLDEIYESIMYDDMFLDKAAEYWAADGKPLQAFIDSLILDILNDEYHLTPIDNKTKQVETAPKEKSNKVFIVHGHDGNVKERTARFIEKLGFEAIILHEQASGGSTTIIEKILEYAKTTDFAIVLYTADDVGGIKKTEPSDFKPRARQNVVFEHGLLIGLLGRENVVPLVADDIEIPNDISGVVYVRDDWQTAIAREMKKAGYEIDFNKLF